MNKELVRDLNLLLADHQVLYQKLRGYHWNVRGPLFFELHAKFEELYLQAAERVDALAERVAALGGQPLSTLKEQLASARLAEDPSVSAAVDMVRRIVADLELLGRSLGEALGNATRLGDSTTTNLLQDMADEQQKTAWMLRAFLAA